jgi:hypothetical protein
MKTIEQVIEEAMIPWPETEDSQLWNKRVDALIELVKEIERKKYEPENGEG